MTTSLRIRRMTLCGLFSALIAIGAFIQIPVPFMDYFTLQFLFVLLAGMLLGPVNCGLAVAVYVAVGLAGVPIFAAGGGISYLFRPSFGYLLGFIAAAWLTGFLCRKSGAARMRQFLPPPSPVWPLPMGSAFCINISFSINIWDSPRLCWRSYCPPSRWICLGTRCCAWPRRRWRAGCGLFW